jgi:hypothetical protein
MTYPRFKWGSKVFDPRYVVMARRLSLSGFTRAEIARNLGAEQEVFIGWCDTYPEFEAAVQYGKVVANFNVIDALYRRCLGYTMITKTSKGEEVVIREEHIAPDVGAIRFWLTNRASGHWRNDVPAEASKPVGGAPLNAREVRYPPKAAERQPDEATPSPIKPVEKKPEQA